MFSQVVTISRLKTTCRDSIRSRIFQILKVIRVFCCFFKEDPRIRWISWILENFKENTDFLQIFLKNLHFSWFLTYVNFSLSAKFNRFFIILGGSPEIDRDFKNRWFSRKIAIFQRKSWFSLIFQILGKIDDFKTPVAVDREELGVILISKVVIYVFFLLFYR